VQIGWVHALMVRFQVVLGEIVSFVRGTQSPEDVILALTNMVANPIEMHVNGFGPFLFDVVIGNSSGCGVVSLYWCGGLGVAQFLEGNVQRTSMLGIEEQGTKFSFSSAC